MFPLYLAVRQTLLTHDYDSQVKIFWDERQVYEKQVDRECQEVWKKAECEIENAVLGNVSLTYKLPEASIRL